MGEIGVVVIIKQLHYTTICDRRNIAVMALYNIVVEAVDIAVEEDINRTID